jgi:hypothetical protein
MLKTDYTGTHLYMCCPGSEVLGTAIAYKESEIAFLFFLFYFFQVKEMFCWATNTMVLNKRYEQHYFG